MRWVLVPVVVMTLAIVSVVSVVVAAPGSTDAGAAKDLAEARRATARYHNPASALADGYVSLVECVASPMGVMGIHYANFGLMDGAVDGEQPEVLMYVPTKSGDRLVGVEYLAVDADQDVTTDDDRPTLFGRPFEGPMPGHGPGMPVHYDLHVWLWQGNSPGIFEDWHTKLTC